MSPMAADLVRTIDDPVNPLISNLLDGLDALEGLDFSENRKTCPYGLITSEKQLELLVNENRLHPEVFGLKNYEFQLAGTINYGPIRFRNDTTQSEGLRDDLIRQLMGRVRVGLGLRGKDIFWVATTEYGYENRIHTHFLVGIAGRALVPTAALTQATDRAFTSLSAHFNESQLGTLHLNKVTNPLGAISYLCKEEYRRPMKHFIFSKTII